MPSTDTVPWQPANPQRLARHFSRLGWLGFWIQAVLLIIPVILLFYVTFLSGPESAHRKGIDLGNYLSYGSLLVMLFTTYWFYTYTRLAPKITDPAKRPTQAAVLRKLWIGLWAGVAGIVFSMILMITAVGRMLLILLTTPQTGIPITAPGGVDPSKTLAAIDAISLKNLVISLTGELVVLSFSLWLLYVVMRPKAEKAGGTAA
jgi:hypothetical protein